MQVLAGHTAQFAATAVRRELRGSFRGRKGRRAALGAGASAGRESGLHLYVAAEKLVIS